MMARRVNSDAAVQLYSPGYESLAGIFLRAFAQASEGKGKERHANDLPFDKQPMQVICGQVGVGFATGQAIKKTEESAGLPHDAKIAELLGAMVYLAGAVLFLESDRPAPKAVPINSPRPWRPSIAEMVAQVEVRPVCTCDECKAVS